MDRSYAVMERLAGSTLNELTYRRPEVLEDNKVTIAYQLGMHMAFAYVFGSKDGYQTNYLFDTSEKLLTRVDKEVFLEVPYDATKTLEDGDKYTQEIAACELSNLKYIPSFRKKDTRPYVLMAFKQGFLDKYSDIKEKEEDLLSLVEETRDNWLQIKGLQSSKEYDTETEHILEAVKYLIDQEPEHVYQRLLKAKKENDNKK